MYIWVLLATLMVALNFYNLSPRRDLENVYNETRVVTLANRFRHEHLAFMQATECEMIGTNRAESSFTGLYGNDAETADGGLTITYTNKKKNLPIGYQLDHEQFDKISHNIICVDEDEITPKSCKEADKIYAISFVPLDDRWINKKLVLKEIDGSTPGDPSDDVSVLAPVSTLTNYLAKAAARTRSTGWTWYDGSDYHLEGFANSYNIDVEKEEVPEIDESGNTVTKTKYKVGFKEYKFPEDIKSVLAGKCNQGDPCIYAVDIYKKNDISRRCATLKGHTP